jgi:hypothetical protein
MKKIVFESDWQSFFEFHQLHGFDDFFHFDRGRIINQNSKRNVVVLELVQDGQRRTFFMKRFIQPHFKDMLSAFCYFGKLCSQAEVEWRNAKILLKNGIETYHPVCFGVQSRLGLEQQSFFITEQISGPCLTDYLSRSWKDLDDTEKKALVVNLGAFFQRIHTAGIRLPDSYLWHIYRIEPVNNGSYTLGIIDLHRMQICTHSPARAAKDLGAFLFSLPDGFMDQRFWALFMDSYLDNRGIRNADAFRRAVQQWGKRISSRRKREVETID